MGDGTCSVEGCDKAVYARRWCIPHYAKWRKYGDPLTVRQYVIPADAVCSVADCSKPVHARTWCKTHYDRWYARPDRSDPSTSRYILGDDDARFWSKVNKAGPLPIAKPELGPCWAWTGALDSRGYGSFRNSGSPLAHRWAYKHLIGPIPVGLTLDHLCMFPTCVNPAHLEPVPLEENIRRRWEAERARRQGRCINGHEMTAENTYRWPDGKRTSCRECGRVNQRRYQERRRGRS